MEQTKGNLSLNNYHYPHAFLVIRTGSKDNDSRPRERKICNISTSCKSLKESKANAEHLVDCWNSHEPDGLVPKLVTALDIIANGNVDNIVAGKRMRAHTVGFYDLREIAHKALALYKASGLAPEGQKGQEAPAAPLQENENE